MEQWTSSAEVIDFAIKNEEEAIELYGRLAGKATSQSMAKVFRSFQKEEEGHKARLLGVKSSGSGLSQTAKTVDLKIGDYLIDVDPDDEEMDYQKALILAMKKEKAAFKLYTDMAEAVDDAGLQELLLGLAQEEAKHKLRFEVEYDNEVMEEN